MSTGDTGAPGAFAQKALRPGPVLADRLLGSTQPGPRGESSAGPEPPAQGSQPGEKGHQAEHGRGAGPGDCSWGPRPGARASRASGSRRSSVARRGREATPLRGPQALGRWGGRPRPRPFSPGFISSHLTLGFPRPTFRGLQTHSAPDFHLPAQRALFAGLHRDANPGAA